MEIFESARIKLTLWYLVIIMVISFSFSTVIYRGATYEVSVLQNRVLNLQTEEKLAEPVRRQIIEGIFLSKVRIIRVLLSVNGVIFVFSTLAGYFLAGKTLEPVKESVEREKRFVADASHELRNPLASIKTTTEVELRNKRLPAEYRETLNTNLTEVNRLIRLTNSLLGLTKVAQMTFVSVSLDKVIKTAIKANKNHQIYKNHQVKLIYKKSDLEVKGDYDALVQIFINLIENAVKYSQADIEVQIVAMNKRRSVEVKVIDKGMGIKAEDLPYIFDRFYRVDNLQKNTEGYGLGLSLVRKLVSEMGGTIYVQSKFGFGTTFSVYLQK